MQSFCNKKILAIAKGGIKSMENIELKDAIEQWVTVRKEMANAKGSEALVEEILQKVAEILVEGVNQEKVIKKMTFDINSKGYVVLIWAYDNHDSKSRMKKWDTLITRYKEGREQIYSNLEQYFKQYTDLRVCGKHATFEGNQYIELNISVKEE